MTFPVQNNISREFINNHNGRRQHRQKMKLKRFARFILSVLTFVLLIVCLPGIIWNTFDRFFIRSIVNSQIQIPECSTFLRSSEKYFANSYLFDTEFLADVETKHPLMTPVTLAGEMPKLTYRLKNLARQMPYLTPGIFIWDFSTGKYVDINADKEFSTASMIKIPIMFQAFRRNELGLLNFKDFMILEPSYVSGGSGYLQYRPVGSYFSTYNLLQLMIQESDNTATNMILSNIGGRDELNRVMRSWGFSQTHMSDLLPDIYGTNVSTPKDLGTMLYNIDNQNFLTLESRAKIVDIMSHVRNRFLIQAGLPDNVQFIHKSGDIGRLLGDAGVVILPDGRRYVIVIMVKRPWNSYSAKEFIIQASKITYNSIVNRDY